MCLACDMPPELNMLLVTLVIQGKGKGGKVAEEDQIVTNHCRGDGWTRAEDTMVACGE